MSTPATFGFATAAIHHGYDPQDHEGALTPPLHLTSTFAFESAEDGAARFSGEAPGHVYSRISNPTVDLLERRIAHLEGPRRRSGRHRAWAQSPRPCGRCCAPVTRS